MAKTIIWKPKASQQYRSLLLYLRDDFSLETAKKRVAAGKTTSVADDEAAVTHASATETAPEHTPLVTVVATEEESTTEDAGASSPAEPAQ